MKYKDLPYSSLFEDKLYEMQESVGRSLKDNMSRFPELMTINFKDMEDGSKVEISIKLKNGKGIKHQEVRYVDDSALELSRPMLQAYWGVSEEELDYYEKELATTDDIKEKEPEIYKQLCREYILSSLPHDNGGEFTDQDEEEIKEIIRSVY